MEKWTKALIHTCKESGMSNVEIMWLLRQRLKVVSGNLHDGFELIRSVN